MLCGSDFPLSVAGIGAAAESGVQQSGKACSLDQAQARNTSFAGQAMRCEGFGLTVSTGLRCAPLYTSCQTWLPGNLQSPDQTTGW